MADLKLQILDFIKRKGPSMPVEIAIGTGINSIIVSAILSDMVPRKQLLMSNKRIGSSHIYFMQDQRDRMRVKLFQLLEEGEKKFVEELEKRRVVLSSELPEEEVGAYRDFLVEFTFGGDKAWHWFELTSDNALSELRSKLDAKKKLPEEKQPEKQAAPAREELKTPLPEKKEEAKKLPAPEKKEEKKPAQEKKEKLVIKKEKPAPKARAEKPDKNYADTVKSWVEEAGAKIVGVRDVVPGMEYEIDAQLQTPFGAQQYLVLVLNYPKKKVGIEDVSKAFSRVMQQKAPVVIVSQTGFAKNAENFWKKEYKGLITLIDGENLG